jgi:hypothetical protein
MKTNFICLLFLLFLLVSVQSFHDCVQPRRSRRLQPGKNDYVISPPAGCNGGLCVGMHGGPHEGGPSSYPAGNSSVGFTYVHSTMTVPEYPKKQDGITYFLWTDVFMGDESYGRMNQFVPQLLLGNVLSGSTGPPDYNPTYSTITEYYFGAHYFFELFDPSVNVTVAKAAYGPLYPTSPGETLFTTFDQTVGSPGEGPVWTLTMGVVGDSSRLSTLIVPKPYMGLGVNWPVPSTRWDELNYTNICINACYEIYGGIDADHLPSSGGEYIINIGRGINNSFPWIGQWDQDEGQDTFFLSTIAEANNPFEQHVYWNISTQ